MIKDTYVTRDVWMAAWLDTEGVLLLGANRYGEWNRVEFTFSNGGDKAWQLATEFRLGGAQVNARQFKESYRFMLDVADRARRRLAEETEENGRPDGHTTE